MSARIEGRNTPGTASAAAARPDLRVLRALLPFMAPYRNRALAAGVFLLLAAAATLVVPPLLRRVIDAGFGPSLAAGDATGLARALGALAVAAAVMAAAAAARFSLVSWLGERVVADIRRAVHANVLAQPPAFFETLRTGEVLSRLTADTTLIQTLVGSSLSMGLRNVVLLAGSVAMLLATAPLLTAAVLAGMGVVLLVTIAFSRRVRRLSRASQDRVADLAGTAGEVLGAIETVQAFGQEGAERDRFAARVEEAFGTAMRRTRMRAWLMLFVMLAFAGGLLWGAWLGGVAVMEGRTTVGTLAQYLFYAVMAGGAASIVAEVWGDLQRAAGAAERLVELLTARPGIGDPAAPLPPPALARSVCTPDVGATGGLSLSFRDVTFRYPSRPERPVLRGLSLEVAPGERVALVGRSGAGKSTLFALLQRLREAEGGRIAVGGLPVDAMRLRDLRKLIAVVPQSPAIFSGDAWFNIRYGRPEASDEEVVAAARAAQADGFLRALPQGYATELGERGVRLSGGQRQRIAIARALLRDAPVLLLDEATSALDAESERAVQAALHAAMQGRTTLVIAHRLATVRDADRVVVMDEGRVAEEGPHDALMARDGLYARLVRLQALAD